MRYQWQGQPKTNWWGKKIILLCITSVPTISPLLPVWIPMELLIIFRLPREFPKCLINPKGGSFHPAPTSEPLISLMSPTSLLSSEESQLGDIESCKNIILMKAKLPIIKLSLRPILLSSTGNFLLSDDEWNKSLTGSSFPPRSSSFVCLGAHEGKG